MKIELNKNEISILKYILDHHLHRVDDETWVDDAGNRTNTYIENILNKIEGSSQMSIHWKVQAQMEDDYTVAYEKHLQEQLKKFKDVAQAELEAMVRASREVEEKEI